MNVSHICSVVGAWRGTPPAAPRPPAMLHGRGLLAAQLAFLTFAALAVWLNIAYYARAWRGSDVSPFTGGLTIAQLREALTGTVLAPATYLGLAIGAQLLGKLVYYVIAGIIFHKRVNEIIALLVATFLIATQTTDFPPTLFALLNTEPVNATLGLATTLVFAILSLWLFFIFPDGRFIPRWTIAIAAIWAIQNASDLFIVRDINDNGPLATAIEYTVVLLAVIIAQAYRYRSISGTIERQQTKWFLGGLGIFFMIFAGGNIYLGANDLLAITETATRSAIPWLVITLANAGGSLALAGALAVAVLRYRLFAIDVIINRALVYGGLTAIVIGLYTFIVGYLGTLLHSGTNLPISLLATGIVAILFQPLRGWLQRVANRLLYGERDEPYTVIARLGQRLEASLAPEAVLPTIVETVAGALKLPYVAIALQDSETTAIAIAYGTAADRATLVVPLSYQGAPVGELRLAPRLGERALSPADQRLVNDLARQAGIAVHAIGLTRDLQRARARLVTAREEERRRLRRDLHDGLGPTLASQALIVDTAALLITDDPHGAAALLREAKTQSQAAVNEIRRVVYALRPPALDDLGLTGALQEAASSYASIRLEIAVAVPTLLPPLSAAVEVAAYRIVQEALVNIARHAHAQHGIVALTIDTALEIAITDDGIGIAADRRAGVGLTSMRERAEELGGTCTVAPSLGGGTRVSARLPL